MKARRKLQREATRHCRNRCRKSPGARKFSLDSNADMVILFFLTK